MQQPIFQTFSDIRFTIDSANCIVSITNKRTGNCMDIDMVLATNVLPMGRVPGRQIEENDTSHTECKFLVTYNPARGR
jgi:hypothetical protein